MKRCGDRSSPHDVIRRGDLERQAVARGARRTAAAAAVCTSSLAKMCLVWVRSVLSETNSSRAISGPLRLGRQQPQHLQLPLAQASSAVRAGASRRRLGRPAAASRSRDSHGCALVEEQLREARPARAPSASARPSVRARAARCPRASWASACSMRISRTLASRPRRGRARASRSSRPSASSSRAGRSAGAPA